LGNRGEERLANFFNAPSFEIITARVKNNLEGVCCHSDPCGDMDGFSRVVYCVKVPRTLFDLFYNSAEGYRARIFSFAV